MAARRAADNECEVEDEHGGDINDEPQDPEPDEPSLGSLDQPIDQTKWAGDGQFMLDADRELDRSDYEPNGDELDGPSDNGVADMDGMYEQCPEYDGRLPWSVGGYVG